MPNTTQTAADPLAEKLRLAAVAEAAAMKIIRETEEIHAEAAYKIHTADIKKPWGNCQKQAAEEMIQQGDTQKEFPAPAREFLLRFTPGFAPAASSAPSTPTHDEPPFDAEATVAEEPAHS